MKKSEFKEYLKNEVLKMTEATDEDIAKQKELNAELEKTKELMGNMEEGKGSTVTISKADMDKLHSDGEIEVDDHTIKFDMKEGRMKKSQFKEYLKFGDKFLIDCCKEHIATIYGSQSNEMKTFRIAVSGK